MTVRVRTWLLSNIGTGDHMRAFNSASTGAAGPTFHLLTEGGDALITEGGDFLDSE